MTQEAHDAHGGVNSGEKTVKIIMFLFSRI